MEDPRQPEPSCAQNSESKNDFGERITEGIAESIAAFKAAYEPTEDYSKLTNEELILALVVNQWWICVCAIKIRRLHDASTFPSNLSRLAWNESDEELVSLYRIH